MTVRELIEALKGLDPDSRVLVNGYEGGCDEPQIQSTRAGLNPEPAGYNGKWIGEDDDFDRPLPADAEPCVVIRRAAPLDSTRSEQLEELKDALPKPNVDFTD